jgi:hypothetical protein
VNDRNAQSNSGSRLCAPPFSPFESTILTPDPHKAVTFPANTVMTISHGTSTNGMLNRGRHDEDISSLAMALEGSVRSDRMPMKPSRIPLCKIVRFPWQFSHHYCKTM